MSLESNNRILLITNVTSNDNGFYKCVISDKSRSDYSIFNFTVRGKFMYLNITYARKYFSYDYNIF